MQSSRAESIKVSYRGQGYQLSGERLIIQGAGPTGAGVCLWPPRDCEHFPRKGWVADTVIRGFGCVEGHGTTPQEALDALDRVLPRGPMVRGGSC